jgi:hypothetical protein
MDHGEFLARIVAPEAPEEKAFQRVAAFARDADTEMLRDALGRAGLHPFYRDLLTRTLHLRELEEIEHERDQQRERLRVLQEGDAALREKEREPPRRRRVR